MLRQILVHDTPVTADQGQWTRLQPPQITPEPTTWLATPRGLNALQLLKQLPSEVLSGKGKKTRSWILRSRDRQERTHLLHDSRLAL